MRFLICILLLFSFLAGAQEKFIREIYDRLHNAPKRFDIPDLSLSYEENFAAIQSIAELKKQQDFIDSLSTAFKQVSAANFSPQTKLLYNCAAFELSLHAERLRLELLWKTEESSTKPGGLYAFPHGPEWYRYFVKKFTGLDVTPEEVFALGMKEVASANKGIDDVRQRLGFKNDSSFCSSLSDGRYFLSDKDSIVTLFQKIDKKVRSKMFLLFPVREIPPILAMEWPEATASTPPGIYLSKRYNSYGMDVFQYNFYGRRFNRRCMEWLYLHEALPGHHLQSVFFEGEAPRYFGTSEGWACYVEKLGKQLGLYEEVYMELGEHEWDLVRSARLVMEVGIHYFGWTKDEAKTYWKKNIRAQDQIADREITRITAWPAQSLCYKMGAMTIRNIVEQQVAAGKTHIETYGFILQNSNLPLQAFL